MVDAQAGMLIGGIALTLLGFGFNAASPSRSTLTTTQASIATNEVSSEISADALAAGDALARERYQSGQCIKSTLPITEGMAVPREYAGGIICDSHGTTAAIARDGRLTLLAKTGRTPAILEGLK